MDTAHPHLPIPWHDLNRITDGKRARKDAPGRYGAYARQREDAIDRQPERLPRLVRRPGSHCQFNQPSPQRLDAVATVGRRRKQRRLRQRRPTDEVGDLPADLFDSSGRCPVALGDDHGAGPYPEQGCDRQVFARLRHHAIVGSHQQQDRVDSGCAGQHRMHQPLVPGNIDQPDWRAVGSRQERVTELDRDAAPLFFRQTIRIDTGQGAHQSRLAVIDVPGGADNHDSGLPESRIIELRTCHRPLEVTGQVPGPTRATGPAGAWDPPGIADRAAAHRR